MEAASRLISSGHWDVGPGSSVRDHLKGSLAFLTQVAPPKATCDKPVSKSDGVGIKDGKCGLKYIPCVVLLGFVSMERGSWVFTFFTARGGFVCSSKHTMRPSQTEELYLMSALKNRPF